MRVLVNSPHTAFEYDLKTGQDICEYQTLKARMRDVDAVIHLAALRGVPESFSQARAYTKTNVLGSVNVLEASKGKRVILASSSSAGYNESPYASSKLAMENYAKVYRSQGLECVSLRYFNVFGPGQPLGAVIPTFISQMLKGEPITVYGNGFQCRDFTYVDNVVQATLQALTVTNFPRQAGPYDVGMGEPVGIRRLITILGDLIGAHAKVIHAPERPGDVLTSCAHTHETKELFGWEPDVGLEEGLKRTIAWHKEMYAHAGTR